MLAVKKLGLNGNALKCIALLPLAFYDGTRGSRKFKYGFYLFYPIHRALLYGIYWLLQYFHIGF